MKAEYSVDFIKKLENEVTSANLLREFRRLRYEPGDVIESDLTGVAPAHRGRGRFEIKKFAGGGFAGQVYQVELLEITHESEPVAGLVEGGTYAMKILVPPSRFSKLFRNFTYWMAYQGPFSAQVNASASRVGVLWQKLIRRGAKIRLGREDAVVDSYATFYHEPMNSYAEINEWVPGRTWLYEIDDNVFKRKKFDPADPGGFLDETASAEYVGKRLFMYRFVQLFHEMGAPELARQYEWWTAKSQPNMLKREGSAEGPMDGLCAIDFRAGLALLPYLPMSPGDFKLIFDGFKRGNLVQFDRGNMEKLEAFVQEHRVEFEDLLPALEELKQVEPAYRASLPDVTHHGFRLLFDKELGVKVPSGLIDGYTCNELVDEEHAEKLSRSSFRFAMFYMIGVIPILGTFLRKLWGHSRFRAHLGRKLTSWSYFNAALRARIAESLIGWHRKGRVSEARAEFLLRFPPLFLIQRFTLGFLPAKWHRFLVEWGWAWNAVWGSLKEGWKFLWNGEYREEWLLERVRDAREEGMITEAEEQDLRDNVKDPVIQKYLLCTALHFCTLPLTQLVAVGIAVWFTVAYGWTWSEALAKGTAILVVMQVIPLSPGSIARGLIVVVLMIKDRNWRDYWIAALIAFWKYIGYLSFPIQMVHKFPVLSRVMAARWATSMVKIIPVFGEKGALIEHWIFDLFFNVPISFGRKKRDKKNDRSGGAEEESGYCTDPDEGREVNGRDLESRLEERKETTIPVKS